VGIGVISPQAAIKDMVLDWTPAPRLMMWIGSLIGSFYLSVDMGTSSTHGSNGFHTCTVPGNADNV